MPPRSSVPPAAQPPSAWSTAAAPLSPPLPAPAPIPGPAAPHQPVFERPAPAKPKRQVTPQTLLLTVGVAFLSVAALVFLTVAFVVMDLTTRSLITAGVTLATIVGAALLRRRGLTATGEAIAVLGLVLLGLDVWAIRANDLFGLAEPPTTGYWGGALLAIAVIAAVWSKLGRLRAPSIAAALAVAPGAILLAAGLTGWSEPPRLWFPFVVAMIVAGAAVVVARWPKPETARVELGLVAVTTHLGALGAMTQLPLLIGPTWPITSLGYFALAAALAAQFAVLQGHERLRSLRILGLLAALLSTLAWLIAVLYAAAQSAPALPEAMFAAPVLVLLPLAGWEVARRRGLRTGAIAGGASTAFAAAILMLWFLRFAFVERLAARLAPGGDPANAHTHTGLVAAGLALLVVMIVSVLIAVIAERRAEQPSTILPTAAIGLALAIAVIALGVPRTAAIIVLAVAVVLYFAAATLLTRRPAIANSPHHWVLEAGIGIAAVALAASTPLGSVEGACMAAALVVVALLRRALAGTPHHAFSIVGALAAVACAVVHAAMMRAETPTFVIATATVLAVPIAALALPALRRAAGEARPLATGGGVGLLVLSILQLVRLVSIDGGEPLWSAVVAGVALVGAAVFAVACRRVRSAAVASALLATAPLALLLAIAAGTVAFSATSGPGLVALVLAGTAAASAPLARAVPDATPATPTRAMIPPTEPASAPSAMPALPLLPGTPPVAHTSGVESSARPVTRWGNAAGATITSAALAIAALPMALTSMALGDGVFTDDLAIALVVIAFMLLALMAGRTGIVGNPAFWAALGVLAIIAPMTVADSLGDAGLARWPALVALPIVLALVTAAVALARDGESAPLHRRPAAAVAATGAFAVLTGSILLTTGTAIGAALAAAALVLSVAVATSLAFTRRLLEPLRPALGTIAALFAVVAVGHVIDRVALDAPLSTALIALVVGAMLAVVPLCWVPASTHTPASAAGVAESSARGFAPGLVSQLAVLGAAVLALTVPSPAPGDPAAWSAGVALACVVSLIGSGVAERLAGGARAAAASVPVGLPVTRSIGASRTASASARMFAAAIAAVVAALLASRFDPPLGELAPVTAWTVPGALALSVLGALLLLRSNSSPTVIAASAALPVLVWGTVAAIPGLAAGAALSVAVAIALVSAIAAVALRRRAGALPAVTAALSALMTPILAALLESRSDLPMLAIALLAIAVAGLIALHALPAGVAPAIPRVLRATLVVLSAIGGLGLAAEAPGLALAAAGGIPAVLAAASAVLLLGNAPRQPALAVDAPAFGIAAPLLLVAGPALVPGAAASTAVLLLAAAVIGVAAVGLAVASGQGMRRPERALHARTSRLAGVTASVAAAVLIGMAFVGAGISPATTMPVDLAATGIAVVLAVAFAVAFRASGRLAPAETSVQALAVVATGMLGAGMVLAMTPTEGVTWALGIRFSLTIGIAAAPMVIALAVMRPEPLATVPMPAHATHIVAALVGIGLWLFAVVNGMGLPIEAVSVPLGAVFTVAGIVALQRIPQLRSWPEVGPGVALLLVPSLLAEFGEPTAARIGVLAAGVVLAIVLGAVLRWQAPILIGSGVGLVHAVVAIRTAFPELVVPWWVWLALAGAVLITVAASYEARKRDAQQLAQAVRSLR